MDISDHHRPDDTKRPGKSFIGFHMRSSRIEKMLVYVVLAATACLFIAASGSREVAYITLAVSVIVAVSSLAVVWAQQRARRDEFPEHFRKVVFVLPWHDRHVLLKASPEWRGLAPPHALLRAGEVPEDRAGTLIEQLGFLSTDDFNMECGTRQVFRWSGCRILFFVLDVDRPAFRHTKEYEGFAWVRDSVVFDDFDGIAPVTIALLHAAVKASEENMDKQSLRDSYYHGRTSTSQLNVTAGPLPHDLTPQQRQSGAFAGDI